MDVQAFLIILCTGIAVMAVAVTLAREGHAENGCGHAHLEVDTISERFYAKFDRPAGPDAESASLERDHPPPGRSAVRGFPRPRSS